ncbi:MAG: LacI family DNA-binding transcriptional regulator [Ramlibacter sp.]
MPKASKVTRRISVHDVARETGVSIGSVSRVLNGGRYTSPDLVARVTNAVRKLGYRPDAKAQSLRRGSSRTIGCLVTDIANPLYAACVSTLETRLAADGYMMLLSSSHYDSHREGELVELFLARGMDGLVVATMDEDDSPALKALRASPLPKVILDRDNDLDSDFVLIDHRSGVASAVRYLAGMGHRRIALFTSGLSMRPGRERAAGYRLAHKALRLPFDPSMVRGISNQLRTSYDEMADLLRRPDPPTALIAIGNHVLAGALRAIHESGLAIPADMSVISIGSSAAAEFVFPPMTLLRFEVESFGRLAAEMLLERLRQPDQPPRKVTMPTQLVMGATCVPPRVHASRATARKRR